MKKYLIISVLSIAISIAIIIQLYKTNDIEWVDDIVEKSTEVLGIKPKMVTEKMQRKEEQRIEETKLAEVAPEVIKVDSAALALESMRDSIRLAGLEAKRPKKLFNAVIDAKEERQSPDSVVIVKVVEPEKPKRKLFNAVVETEPKRTEQQVTPAFSFFNAAVHGAQKFKDDQVVTFRTTQAVELNGLSLPENFVFTAKANVFDGRIHFIIKNLKDQVLNGENFSDKSPGMPLTSNLKFGQQIVLSDGHQITFGVHL